MLLALTVLLAFAARLAASMSLKLVGGGVFAPPGPFLAVLAPNSEPAGVVLLGTGVRIAALGVAGMAGVPDCAMSAEEEMVVVVVLWLALALAIIAAGDLYVKVLLRAAGVAGVAGADPLGERKAWL